MQILVLPRLRVTGGATGVDAHPRSADDAGRLTTNTDKLRRSSSTVFGRSPGYVRPNSTIAAVLPHVGAMCIQVAEKFGGDRSTALYDISVDDVRSDVEG